jgi:hypothetical protein
MVSDVLMLRHTACCCRHCVAALVWLRKPILKSIIEDREEFNDGGWEFLNAEGGSDAEGDDGEYISLAPTRSLPPSLFLSLHDYSLLRPSLPAVKIVLKGQQFT